VGVVFKHFEKEEHGGVQLELNLSQKGWIETIDSVNSYSRRISYVELPFMSQFYAGTYKSNVFFQVGPYLGYSIAAKEKDVINELEGARNYKFTDADNRFDLGLAAGVGIKQAYSFGIFQLEGRFSYGVSNAVKAIGSRNFSAAKNMAVTLSLAYMLDYSSIKPKRKIPGKTDTPYLQINRQTPLLAKLNPSIYTMQLNFYSLTSQPTWLGGYKKFWVYLS
jgi:hypothetical protein